MLQPQTPQSAHKRPSGMAPHTLGLGFVLLLHTVAIYALVTALRLVPMPPLPNVLTVRTLPLPQRPEALPPRLVMPMPLPPPVAPTIEPLIDLGPQPPSANAISNRPAEALPPPISNIGPAVAVRPALAIDGTHTSPEYPIVSRRLGEQGNVRLQLTIGEDGMVSMAKILQSSGFKRLDDAAVDWVIRHWRYRPAMRGAMPVESTTETLMQFRLN
jgi:periplasmic protein TonB